MAGTSDVDVLKATLLSQQQLLQKLYVELDVERESSATATNEALSMILRLQSEKAALKMEASQYKRLAEQKIGHAEESLAILEELIYQKEMEISSLEFQVQAYRYKLLSIGCDDLNVLDRNDALNGEKGFKATVKRLSSLPACLPMDFYLKKSNDGENNPGPVQDSCSTRDSAGGDFKSYLEQIRILDEKVKEISNTSSLNERSISTSACSSSVVHDVFEVPDVYEVPNAGARSKSCFDEEKGNGKSILESHDRLTKPDLIMEDRDEIDWIKMNNFLSGKAEKTSGKMRDGLSADCKPALIHRDHQAELKQLSQRVEQLESGRSNARHEIVEGREEELNLLKGIREQLNSMQSEMRSWRQKEQTPSPSDEVNLVPLTEAMLYFWL